MSYKVKNLNNYESSDTDDGLEAQEAPRKRKVNTFRKVATRASLEEAKKLMKEKEFAFNYRVSANTATQREVNESLKSLVLILKNHFFTNRD